VPTLLDIEEKERKNPFVKVLAPSSEGSICAEATDEEWVSFAAFPVLGSWGE